ncbi:RagB/SusD family nutrient uptake outer membrane protein [Myroides odoratimimus]|uniref:RagB/SusD family nutrient uptake outer membrane protein n=1 Tax=Myroides odoratimimus TaxID=76832 RepID=UPI00046AF163|nr:RagB/SusD family nutrient uptake outer membrane protein [Myroides odoratimimus]
MKTKIMIALSASLLLGACSKDFLETSSTANISKSDIDKISELSPHLGEATLNGLYAYNVRAGGGGTTGHDDYGQKGYDVYTDILSGDMNQNKNTYGWYSRIANFSGILNFADETNYKGWRFYYYMIRGTNNIIVSYNGKTELTNNEKKVLAESKALRAYMYYNLMMMYTKGYEANEKLLPVYTDPSLANKPAKKTQEVFELMISDLKESLKLYEEINYTKGPNINYYVAKGFLAYVYAAKGTTDALQEAATLTESILNEGGYPLATKSSLVGGFNKAVSNPNWMWSAVLTLDNKLNLISWYGQVDVFTYSYAALGDTKGMAFELYQQIPEGDVRKGQFVVDVVKDANGRTRSYGTKAVIAANKFYSAKGKILEGQRYIESDYVFMRIEEMYLLNAEVNSRLGNDAKAKETLKDMLSIRLDDTSHIDNLSGKALLDQVLLQTRIELWGEGKAYAAIKRNKGTFKYASNHLDNPNGEFQYDDERMTFKVPQAELLNNTVYND